MTRRILSLTDSDSFLKSLAYSRPESTSWIEQGPTTSSSRLSLPNKISEISFLLLSMNFSWDSFRPCFSMNASGLGSSLTDLMFRLCAFFMIRSLD